MIRSLSLLLCGAVLAGCAWHHPKPEKANGDSDTSKIQDGKAIVTPATAFVGKAVRVNESGRFVVINFPVGGLPSDGQMLDAYRQGMKVGEVKVTGPAQDENTVADITAGEVQVGDELRNR